MSRARFIVRGFVQGVNYRATAVHEARRLALTGRVWNRDDGGVGVLAEGDDAALDAFERWLWRGPRAAEVSAVERAKVSGDARYDSFDVSWRPAPD
jgi:acylphosphatase